MSRLELAWVADILARDVVNELLNSPGGIVPFMLPSSMLADPDFKLDTGKTDPFWETRYPGW